MTALHIIAQLHLAAGIFAIVAGFSAMLLPKGYSLHKLVGKIFFYIMIGLCVSGIHLTFVRSLQFTFFLSIFSLYLLLTGWYAMARKSSSVTVFDKIGFYVISTIGITRSCRNTTRYGYNITILITATLVIYSLSLIHI